ncbi:MAG TPA: NUDIX domain-containing protein [Candidatus Saccharimonadales bacterium]|nr:NUDIX domain-containing protein [Candidatus Saccharimonadales bacterium]
MPHIHTQPGEHDQTASAFIVRLSTTEPKLLLHRHKKLGTFLQFGGHVEKEENPWAGVLHEIEEEAGYTVDQLSVLQPKNVPRSLKGATLHPYPVCLMTHLFSADHFHTDIEFAFTVLKDSKKEIAPGESTTIRGFTRDELAALPEEEIPGNVREIGMFIFDICLGGWIAVSAEKYDTA